MLANELAVPAGRGAITLFVLVACFVVLGYTFAKISNVFSAQIGLFLGVAIIQCVMSLLAVLGIRKLEKYKVDTLNFRDPIWSLSGYALLTIIMTYGVLAYQDLNHLAYFNNLDEIPYEMGALLHGRIFIMTLGIFLIVGLLALIFFQVWRKYILKTRFLDVGIAYQDTNLDLETDRNIYKIIFVNGTHGSRRTIQEAYKFCEKNKIRHAVFIGPLYGTRFTLIERYSSTNWEQFEVSLLNTDNGTVLSNFETRETDRASARVQEIEAYESGNYVISTQNQSIHSSMKNDMTFENVIAHTVKNEVRWTKMQSETAQISHGIRSVFIPKGSHDNFTIGKRKDRFSKPSSDRLAFDLNNDFQIRIDVSQLEKSDKNQELSIAFNFGSEGSKTVLFAVIGSRKESGSESVFVPLTESFAESGAMVGEVVTIDASKRTISYQLAVR